MSAPQIPYYYLFNGPVEDVQSNGTLILKKESLDTLRDFPIAVKGINGLLADKVYHLATNSNGVLYYLDLPTPQKPGIFLPPFSKRLKTDLKFFLPPPGAIELALAAEGEKWAEKLTEFYNSIAEQGISLSFVVASWSHMRKPQASPDSESEQDYANWYNRCTNRAEKLYGFIITKKRGVFVLFTNNLFNRSRVRLKLIEASPPIQTSAQPIEHIQSVAPTKVTSSNSVGHIDGSLYLAQFLYSEDRFPAGLYKINVQPETPDTLKNFLEPYKSKKEYDLVEKISFDLKTLVGDFDIIIADPISLEENLLQQFPVHFAHLLQAVNEKQQRMPTDETSADETLSLPDTFKAWEDRIFWTYKKSKMLVSTINDFDPDEKNEFVYNLVGLLYPASGLADEVDCFKKSYDLYMGFRDWNKTWKNFIKSWDFEKKIAAAIKNFDNKYRQTRTLLDLFRFKKVEQKIIDALLSDSKLQRKIGAMENLDKATYQRLKKMGLSVRQNRTEKAFGMSPGSLKKGLFVIGTAFDLYSTYQEWNKAVAASTNLSESISDLQEYLTSYRQTLLATTAQGQSLIGTNRHALAVLEKARALTVANKLELDEAAKKALEQSIDTILGVLVVVPVVGEFVALFLAAKALLEAGVSVVSSLTTLIDKYVFASRFTHIAGNYKVLGALLKSAEANQALMYEEEAKSSAENLHVQWRMRAEALYGLLNLIVRAALAISARDNAQFEKEFSEKFTEYKIDEYIATYIMKDSWMLPVKPLIPITMDAFHLATRSRFGLYVDLDKFIANFDLSFGYLDIIEGMNYLNFAYHTGKPIVNELLKKNFKANFQKYFPIHTIETGVDFDSLKKLALNFKLNMPNFTDEDIVYTRVYRRENKDWGGDEKAGWVPVVPGKQPGTGATASLSPFDHIRVLIVLRKDLPQGIYPISLQVIRYDTLPVNGPVYKSITRILDKDLLLALPEEEAFIGYSGCVFYPFYTLANKTFPGIKPLAHSFFLSDLSILGANNCYHLGFFSNMTYAFKVKPGGEGEEWLPVRLGGTVKPSQAPGKPATVNREEGDTFSVSIDLGRNTDEGVLLVKEFLAEKTSDFKYPPLFKYVLLKALNFPCCSIGPLLVSTGAGLVPVGWEEKKEFNSFNWQGPCELILFIGIKNKESDLDIPTWQNAKLNWKQTPLQITLMRADFGVDTEGPPYLSTLNYLGTLKGEPDYTFQRDSSFAARDLADVVHKLETKYRINQKSINDWLHNNIVNMIFMKHDIFIKQNEELDIFAVNFKVEYIMPGNKKIYSLRPFGAITHSTPQEKKYYEYYFKVSSPTGLQPIGLEARLKLAAPQAGAAVPWNERDAKHRTWIEKYPRCVYYEDKKVIQ